MILRDFENIGRKKMKGYQNSLDYEDFAVQEKFVARFGNKDIVFKSNSTQFRIVKTRFQGDYVSRNKSLVLWGSLAYERCFVNLKPCSVTKTVGHVAACLCKNLVSFCYCIGYFHPRHVKRAAFVGCSLNQVQKFLLFCGRFVCNCDSTVACIAFIAYSVVKD